TLYLGIRHSLSAIRQVWGHAARRHRGRDSSRSVSSYCAIDSSTLDPCFHILLKTPDLFTECACVCIVRRPLPPETPRTRTNLSHPRAENVWRVPPARGHDA